jgi:hypothetical protein
MYTKLILILFLGVSFLLIPAIADYLGRSLDNLPTRIGVISILLASVYYDPYVSLALFMVLCSLYVRHHRNDLMGISGIGNLNLLAKSFETSSATTNLNMGGESEDIMEPVDFMPGKQVQDNAVTKPETSIDEKQVLVSEPLGSKAEALFSERPH